MNYRLVVDDSEFVRRMARSILEDLASRPKEAEEGQKALDMCRDKMPDAVLLGWNMLVVDGM